MGVSHVPEKTYFSSIYHYGKPRNGCLSQKGYPNGRDDLEYVFSLFPILKKQQKQLGGTLEWRRTTNVGNFRALMGKPKLLLLDEPSLGLAPLIVKQIFEILRKINQEHPNDDFLVEQNANLALRSAHRGYVMENGKIILQDQTSKLLDNDRVKKRIWSRD